MNNAWSTITLLRAPCAAPQSRSKPLLRLFNGYAKSRTQYRSLSCFDRQHPNLSDDHKSQQPATQYSRANWTTREVYRSFSTTSHLTARPKDRRKPPLPPKSAKRSKLDASPESDSKLRPAQTVASHTEGLPTDNEPLTWRDYDPAGGMPLPNGELSQPEINAVFNGEEVDVDTGNYILSVMHWRRLSGALIDDGLNFPKESGVDREMALKGLQYVRNLVPDVDESAAGQVWAEEESQRLQEQIQARAVKLGIYKALPEEEVEEEQSQQGTEYGRQKTGESVLIQVRKANEAAWEQEQAERAAAEERAATATLHATRGPLELGGGVQKDVWLENTNLTRAPGGGVKIAPPPPKAWLQPVDRKPWVKYYEQQATIIKDNAVPQLSNFQRLGPSFLLLLLTLGGCYYLYANYTPPPTSARMWPDTPPAVATLSALTGILVGAFLLGRFPPMWKFFNRYMCIVPAYPYALGLLGNTLRHDTAMHLFWNTVSLWLFGLMLHDEVGRGTFLAIYFASGALGAYCSLGYNVYRKLWEAYIFGASGSIYGIVAAACTLRPHGTIQTFGYDLPLAAWVFLALFGCVEGFAMLRGVKGSIDHAAHLGGLISGLSAALYLRRASTKIQGDSDAEKGATENQELAVVGKA